MRAGFVLDCSIATAWPFHDEATPKTTALMNRLATTCACLVVHRNYERPLDGRVQGSPTQSDALIADLGRLGIERDNGAPNSAMRTLGGLGSPPPKESKAA